MALILETGSESDLDDRQVGTAQEFLCPLNAAVHQKLLRCLAG